MNNIDRTARRIFFNDRGLAFNTFMDLDVILPFLQKYHIPFSDPTAPLRDFPYNQLRFWTMCYVTNLILYPPNAGAYIRAEIWLYAHQQRTQILDERSNVVAVISGLTWSVLDGTYTINNKLFHIPPRLIERPIT